VVGKMKTFEKAWFRQKLPSPMPKANNRGIIVEENVGGKIAFVTVKNIFLFGLLAKILFRI